MGRELRHVTKGQPPEGLLEAGQEAMGRIGDAVGHENSVDRDGPVFSDKTVYYYPLRAREVGGDQAWH